MLEQLLYALTNWERHKVGCEACREFDASIEGDGTPCKLGMTLFRRILFLLRSEPIDLGGKA